MEQVQKVKYPRTLHLPNSPGRGSDDKVLTTTEHFVGKEIVILEKMDGENTTIYDNGYCHARSLDSNNHPSRNWVKGFASSISNRIPHGMRICGENVYAQHSIMYDNLKSFFYGFSVWQGQKCYSWDDTVKLFEVIGITPVRVIYRGQFDAGAIGTIIKSLDLDKIEGFVLRTAGAFEYNDFATNVAKWVRPNHIQSDMHWSKQWKPNKISL